MASPDDPLSIGWVDTARLRDDAGLPDSVKDAYTERRWGLPVGYVMSDPLTTQFLSREIGFDPMEGERTVTVGIPPDQATLFVGVDTDGARDALEDLGAEEDGDFLAIGDEGEVLAGDPTLLGLNRVAIEGDELAAGAYEAPVAAALGRQGTPLLDVGGVAAAADCLGPDALVAQVDEPAAAGEGVALQAVGAEVPGDDDVVPEIVCAVGEPGEDLADVADCMEASFNDGGVDPQTRRPYEDILGPAQVSDGELDGTSWVRASFEPPVDGPVGITFAMALQGSLAGPLGGDEAGAAGSRATPEQIGALEDELPDAC